MSGAIWSEAKKHSYSWRRFWPRWRRAKQPQPARSVVVASPLVLVGTYEHDEGLNRAEKEFAEACFDSNNAVFVRACRTTEMHWWSGIMDWARRLRAGQAANPPQPPFHIHGAEDLLVAGGGFVLVHCAARFHQACEIIERTGGRVGVARSAG